VKLLRQTGNCAIGFEDAPMPTPRAGEVIVKTVLSAICGSELGIYRTGMPSGNAGHEAVGTIVDVAADVMSVARGQRVGVGAVSGCGKCEYCAARRFTWCREVKFTWNMHAAFIAIPAMSCNVLPDDIGWETGVLISGDGFGVPYHSSKYFHVPEEEAVAVIGLGPIGLGAVLMQSFLGRKVIGVDKAPDRIDHARRLGASEVILAEEGTDVVQELRALTRGLGPVVCIEAAGTPGTVATCFAAVRCGGTVVFNGETRAKVLSPSADFIRKDVSAVGTWYFQSCEFPEMVSLVRRGLKPEVLISHRFEASEAPTAFRMVSEGKTAKAVLRWPDG